MDYKNAIETPFLAVLSPPLLVGLNCSINWLKQMTYTTIFIWTAICWTICYTVSIFIACEPFLKIQNVFNPKQKRVESQISWSFLKPKPKLDKCNYITIWISTTFIWTFCNTVSIFIANESILEKWNKLEPIENWVNRNFNQSQLLTLQSESAQHSFGHSATQFPFSSQVNPS